MKAGIFLIVAFISCGKTIDSRLVKSSYLGDEIRIEGLYYSPITSDGDMLCTFFYKDGVIIRGGYETLEEIETKQLAGQWWDEEFILPKGILGIFTINDQSITIEEYIAGAGTTETQEAHGTIRNDTTIVINKLINNLYNTEEDVEIELKFYPFSPKPDSTNTFIK